MYEHNIAPEVFMCSVIMLCYYIYIYIYTSTGESWNRLVYNASMFVCDCQIDTYIADITVWWE